MKTLEEHTIDKSEWGPGPWQSEPDRKLWIDPGTLLPCLIVRRNMGFLCGYVGVLKDHPWFGKDYGELYVDVHGGLTYSGPGPLYEGMELNGEDIWWFGFDCAHWGDRYPFPAPREGDMMRDDYRPYRTFEYVTKEVERLAIQAQEAINV